MRKTNDRKGEKLIMIWTKLKTKPERFTFSSKHRVAKLSSAVLKEN